MINRRIITRLILFACVSISWVRVAYAAESNDLPIVSLAHVAFQVSNIDQSSRYYQRQFGFEEAFHTSGTSPSIYLKISDQQFIKLVEVPGETADNRLIEVAFLVSDLATTVERIEKKGWKPSAIFVAEDGTFASKITDPDGHRLLFVEYNLESMQAQHKGEYLGAERVSNRMQHVGITVKNEDAANTFYRDVLGFKEVWRASRTDGGPDAWVGMQLPGGSGNYVEYILIPDIEPNRRQLGSMHHLCLLTDDIHATHKQLLDRGLPNLDRYVPRVGRSNRWLLNTYDLDGTRTEFMEEGLAR